MSDNSMPILLITKRWVRSAVKSDTATTTARGGSDVVRKYLREIIKYVGIAVCQWRPAVMLEFYPNAETVSSVVARFERFADCCNQAISLIEKVDLDRHWRDTRWRVARS